jgi:flagellar biosynthesis GTPase FlhF
MEAIKVFGMVEIRDKYGNPVLIKKNKITKKGVEIFAKKLVDGLVEIEKVKVGTGTEIATENDTDLGSPLPFDFAIINRSSERVNDRAFSANYVSMIETDDPNASFSFSEAGLFARDHDTSDILVARVVFPTKFKKPFNEYYLTWKIILRID